MNHLNNLKLACRESGVKATSANIFVHASFFFPSSSMEKDLQFYEGTIDEVLNAEYMALAKRMLADGSPHEKIVDALLKLNAQHVTEMLMVGSNLKEN